MILNIIMGANISKIARSALYKLDEKDKIIIEKKRNDHYTVKHMGRSCPTTVKEHEHVKGINLHKT